VQGVMPKTRRLLSFSWVSCSYQTR
jgi:hypothetical protein